MTSIDKLVSKYLTRRARAIKNSGGRGFLRKKYLTLIKMALCPP